MTDMDDDNIIDRAEELIHQLAPDLADADLQVLQVILEMAWMYQDLSK